jgi:acyl-CoA synthetase (AMP-forming)/AMP-acid ligase II
VRPDEGVLTIRSALDRACRWFAGNTALAQGARTVSYAEFGTRTRAIASGYRRLGLKKGDRVAFLCAASIDHSLAYYASHRLGAIAVNLHLREPADAQSRLIERLEPRVLVHDAERAPLAAELASRHRFLVRVSTGPAEDAGCASIADLGAHGERDDDVAPPLREDDPAIIQLSSGSTGMPKALVHSHRSVLETWSGGLHMWSGISPDDRFLNGFAPSFVVWLVHAGAFLAQGGSVWLQSTWDPKAFLAAVHENRITCAALTPTQWRTVLAAGPEDYDLRSLRMAAYLGEKLEPDRLRELMRRVCPEFSSFYGMSECLGLGGCVVRGSEIVARGKWGSVGRAGLNSDLRIVDLRPEGVEEMPAGEPGEIVVRAASFAQDNWGDPDWQRRVLTPDGWYRTGDRGWIDADGYVYLQGRVDNQIATGGIKVAPEEIEQVIAACDGVAAAAVFGVDDERWGQRIVALVVRRRESLTRDDLEQWCRGGGRLASYKCPKEWHFADALPLTSVGKLDRKALAKAARTAAGGPEAGVAQRVERPVARNGDECR